LKIINILTTANNNYYNKHKTKTNDIVREGAARIHMKPVRSGEPCAGGGDVIDGGATDAVVANGDCTTSSRNSSIIDPIYICICMCVRRQVMFQELFSVNNNELRQMFYDRRRELSRSMRETTPNCVVATMLAHSSTILLASMPPVQPTHEFKQ
jgi:hypothetical protein